MRIERLGASGIAVLGALAFAACAEEEPTGDDDTSDTSDDDSTPADDDTGTGDDDTGTGDDDTTGTGDDDTTGTGDDDVAAQDRTFHLNLADATVTEPFGLDAILDPILVDYHLLLMPHDFQADSLDLLFALGAEDGSGSYVQDMTYPTVKVADAQWDDPRFAIVGDVDLTIDLGDGVTIDLTDTSLDAAFANSGNEIVDGDLEAMIDTRNFDSLLGGDEGAVCDLLEGLGTDCVACPGTGEAFCMVIAAEGVTGSLVPGVELVAIEP